MAYIQARYNQDGDLLHYRLFVSDGLDWTGKQRRRYKVWYPEKPGISQKQMEKAAMAGAFKFEEEFKAGYILDNRKKFYEYAEYVIDLKARTGLSDTIIERYESMLPRILTRSVI